ncbi:MAG: ABC transporter permease DevC [Synechococcales bacterium]|nr:ABC transporter permease DevC [Synechococcales bacterium]
MASKMPLSWLQLIKEKGRLIVALAGITFADILMFVQLGLLDALYDSATQGHRDLDTDLVVVNRQVKTLIDLQSFPRTRLYQASAHPDVSTVSPLYIGFAPWRNPETQIQRNILVWGIDPAKPPFAYADLQENSNYLKLLDRVLFDQASRPEYGSITEPVSQTGRLEAQVANQTIQVVGLFELGASFGADGNIITSDTTFANLFGDRSLDQIDIGLIKVRPEASLEATRQQLQDSLPDDIKVLTKGEFVDAEIQYWAEQGTGFIFQLGVGVGFVVGIVIVYQILYANVSEHLPQYATLKAMGYGDRYLLMMLFQQSLILAVLGFIPGLLLSVGLYKITYAATLLAVVMKFERALLVLGLTIIMCSVSGTIAMRKLQTADPADVF